MSWYLIKICCGHDDGSESFETWHEASAARTAYTRDISDGHLHYGLITDKPQHPILQTVDTAACLTGVLS